MEREEQQSGHTNVELSNPENRRDQDVSIEIAAGQTILNGDLHVPARARGVVVFAHGSGSSRLSPRNQFVARSLQRAGLATLLFDLLTAEEESRDRTSGHLRFDIDLLAGRLLSVVEWIGGDRELRRVKLGCFGASTGAAAALVAAAQAPQIATIVARGGRPDLAGAALEQISVPVLLIVGGEDRTVLKWNRQAMSRLAGEKKLEVIPGATHLFEEPGALEQVAELGRRWFESHLAGSHSGTQAA